EVADARVVRIAVTQGEPGGVDVHVVRAAKRGDASAVAGEFAVLDQHVAAAAEHAVLVVVKIAAADGEVLAVGTDAGAVLVRNGRAGEFDVLHRDVRAGRHPDRLAVRDRRRRNEMRAPADAAQSKVARRPGRRGAVVDAGVDLDHVAARESRDLARVGELAPGADLHHVYGRECLGRDRTRYGHIGAALEGRAAV